MTWGVIIKHYHADNGRFAERGWMDHCKNAGQTLSFCRVGAHHQNGRAERRIWELQEMGRTQLIHAQCRWPEAITANLWPYALWHANACLNAIPNMQDPQKRSLKQLFTGTTVQANHKHWKPFGSPVFVLQSVLEHRTLHVSRQSPKTTTIPVSS